MHKVLQYMVKAPVRGYVGSQRTQRCIFKQPTDAFLSTVHHSYSKSTCDRLDGWQHPRTFSLNIETMHPLFLHFFYDIYRHKIYLLRKRCCVCLFLLFVMVIGFFIQRVRALNKCILFFIVHADTIIFVNWFRQHFCQNPTSVWWRRLSHFQMFLWHGDK